MTKFDPSDSDSIQQIEILCNFLFKCGRESIIRYARVTGKPEEIIGVRLFGQPYTHDKHRLRHLKLETWVTPAFGLQFLFKSQWGWINGKIEKSILEADKTGVKVIGLGALNKNEALVG